MLTLISSSSSPPASQYSPQSDAAAPPKSVSDPRTCPDNSSQSQAPADQVSSLYIYSAVPDSVAVS